MNRKRMNLRIFETDVNVIDRSGAESLIPTQEASEIIQGTIAQSAVLSRGRKLANMTSKQYKMPVLDMLPMKCSSAQHVDSAGYTRSYGHVTSANRNEYPSVGLQDGFRYEYKGTIGQALSKIEKISSN